MVSRSSKKGGTDMSKLVAEAVSIGAVWLFPGNYNAGKDRGILPPMTGRPCPEHFSCPALPDRSRRINSRTPCAVYRGLFISRGTGGIWADRGNGKNSLSQNRQCEKEHEGLLPSGNRLRYRQTMKKPSGHWSKKHPDNYRAGDDAIMKSVLI